MILLSPARKRFCFVTRSRIRFPFMFHREHNEIAAEKIYSIEEFYLCDLMAAGSRTVDNTSLHRGPEGRGPHVSSCKHLQGQRGSRVFKLVPAQLSCAQHARKTVLGSGVLEIGLTKNRERNWRPARLVSSGFSSHTRMRSIHFGTGIKIKFLVK